MSKVPDNVHPALVGDFYLRAILDELMGLRADVQALKAPEVQELRGSEQVITLQEPEAPVVTTPKKKGR